MAKKLFVGSLPYSVTDERLRDLFAEAGEVTSAKVIMDRETNRSKGFGFVEMATEEQAQAAVSALNGKEIDGRRIAVAEARPQEGGGGGGGGGGRPPRGEGGGRRDFGGGQRRY